MRKMNLFLDPDLATAAERCGSRRPFSNTVHCEDGSICKRRRKKSGCGVAEVVLREEQARFEIVAAAQPVELLDESSLLQQLFPKPVGHRSHKRLQASWGEGQISFNEPLNLWKGFLV